MQNQDIIRAVVFMMGADGEYGPDEMQFLNRLCGQLNLPRKCVIDAFKGMNSGGTRIKIPKDPEARSRIMDHLIDAAMSDGEIVEREQKVLERAAAGMGIPASEVGRRIGSRLQPDLDPDADLLMMTADDLLNPAGAKNPAGNALATCPKCGYEAVGPDDMLLKGPYGAGECPSCGIIVDKYRQPDRS